MINNFDLSNDFLFRFCHLHKTNWHGTTAEWKEICSTNFLARWIWILPLGLDLIGLIWIILQISRLLNFFCWSSWWLGSVSSSTATTAKLLKFWRSFYSASTASTTSSFDQSGLLYWPNGGCCPASPAGSRAASPASDSDFILSGYSRGSCSL